MEQIAAQLANLQQTLTSGLSSIETRLATVEATQRTARAGNEIPSGVESGGDGDFEDSGDEQWTGLPDSYASAQKSNAPRYRGVPRAPPATRR